MFVGGWRVPVTCVVWWIAPRLVPWRTLHRSAGDCQKMTMRAGSPAATRAASQHRGRSPPIRGPIHTRTRRETEVNTPSCDGTARTGSSPEGAKAKKKTHGAARPRIPAGSRCGLLSGARGYPRVSRRVDSNMVLTVQPSLTRPVLQRWRGPCDHRPSTTSPRSCQSAASTSTRQAVAATSVLSRAATARKCRVLSSATSGAVQLVRTPRAGRVP